MVSGSRGPQGHCHHSLCQPRRTAYPILAYSAFLSRDLVSKQIQQMQTVDWTPDFKSLFCPALVCTGSVREAKAVPKAGGVFRMACCPATRTVPCSGPAHVTIMKESWPGANWSEQVLHRSYTPHSIQDSPRAPSSFTSHVPSRS